MSTTQTLENSVSLLLCSFFHGSLKINALARYLEVSHKFNFSKDAQLIDGTMSSFDMDNVKSEFKPDLYICDRSRKQILLIESKVRNERSLEDSQIKEEEGSYIDIINQLSEGGWKSHLIFIHPENYIYKDKINEFLEKRDNVSAITWNKFVKNIDNESDFNFFKNSLINLGIAGVDLSCDSDFFTQPVDFTYIRPMVISQQKIILAYLNRLFEDCSKEITARNKRNVHHNAKSFGLGDTQYIRNFDQDPFGDYTNNPVIEYCIDFRWPKKNKYCFVVLGFDFAKNKFAIYYDISNDKGTKREWIYNEDLELPLYCESYKNLKASLYEKLKQWLASEYKRINEFYEQK